MKQNGLWAEILLFFGQRILYVASSFDGICRAEHRRAIYGGFKMGMGMGLDLDMACSDGREENLSFQKAS